MSSYHHRGPTAVLLAGLASALAGLGPVHANDRDLRATTVPVTACAVGDNNLAAPAFAPPMGGALVGSGTALALSSKTTGAQFLSLFCPLPLNNVDLSGTTNDNDISKVRVHYKDNDGFGTNARIVVQLARGVISSTEPTGVSSILACQWISPQFAPSPTPTGGTRVTFPCAVDLTNGAFYAFALRLEVAQSATPGAYQVTLLGFDFPQ